MLPLASQIQPEPDCVNERAPSRPLASPATLTCTTAGSTAAAISRIDALIASNALELANRSAAASMERAVRSTCASRINAGTVQRLTAAAASNNAAGSARSKRESLMMYGQPSVATAPIHRARSCTDARQDRHHARGRATPARLVQFLRPPQPMDAQKQAANASIQEDR